MVSRGFSLACRTSLHGWARGTLNVIKFLGPESNQAHLEHHVSNPQTDTLTQICEDFH